MARGIASGRKVSARDLPIIIGMIVRGDRHHDIAAWFGLNQGRIKDAQDGKYGPPSVVAGTALPPAGPPGIKGRVLREEVEAVLGKLLAGDLKGAAKDLRDAADTYDTSDP